MDTVPNSELVDRSAHLLPQRAIAHNQEVSILVALHGRDNLQESPNSLLLDEPPYEGNDAAPFGNSQACSCDPGIDLVRFPQQPLHVNANRRQFVLVHVAERKPGTLDVVPVMLIQNNNAVRYLRKANL